MIGELGVLVGGIIFGGLMYFCLSSFDDLKL
jgi:formate/nitrite transporter FocA (FNT family)